MLDIFDKLEYQETPKKTDIFDKIEYEPAPSFLKETQRHLTRGTSRIAESILGLPSDILKTAQSLLAPVEKSAGKIREKIGLKPLSSSIKKPGFPGSEEFKTISTKVFGQKVLPQSQGESLLDDIISDASVLAIPVKGKIPFLKSLGTALAGNLASEGIKSFGGGEKAQAGAKIGTFFLSALTGKGNVKKFWNDQYKLAEEAIPKGAELKAHKLERQLDSLKRNLKKGGIETPSQKFVTKPLEELEKSIHEGHLAVEDAVSAKKKINELRASLFDEIKGDASRKYARTKINDIANFLDESLESYGKENPKFFEHYKSANEAFGGYQQSKRVGNWIKRHLPINKLGKAGILIVEGLFKPATLKYTIPGYGLFKGGELLTRMFKNPTLRNYYSNIIKNAVEENATGVLRNVKKFEKELQDKEPDIFNELTRQQNANE